MRMVMSIYITGFWYIYERAHEHTKIRYLMSTLIYIPKSNILIRMLMSILLDFGIYGSVLISIPKSMV
jgi:hypothetical protein